MGIFIVNTIHCCNLTYLTGENAHRTMPRGWTKGPDAKNAHICPLLHPPNVQFGDTLQKGMVSGFLKHTLHSRAYIMYIG